MGVRRTQWTASFNLRPLVVAAALVIYKGGAVGWAPTMRTMFMILCFANIALGQAVSSQNTDDPFNAPDVYDDGAPGVTAPRVVKDVKPEYTRGAMRNRIQGVIGLTAIVERDGTVGLVRVTQSLDPEYGLDAMAAATLKRWRFSPATRDGLAVRARIRVEMTFSVGSRGQFPAPTVEWPAAFFARMSPLENTPEQWIEQTVTAASLRITIRYPKTWNAASHGGDKVFAVTSDDVRYPRGFAISQPVTVPADQTATMSERILDKMADQVKKLVDRDGGFKLLEFGQVRAPQRLWFWAEMYRSLPRPTGGNDGMRLWAFTTTERRQQVTVFCSVIVPGDSYTTEERDQVNRAGADFAAVIKRITIAPE